MEKNSIGLIELSSIAAGFLVADTMIKAADVQLVLNRTICSGKFLVLIGGEVAAVQAAVAAGAGVADWLVTISHTDTVAQAVVVAR